MKLGFALKKTKKSALAAAPGAFAAAPAEKDASAERVYVTDFDPSAVVPAAGENKTATLVIPLRKTNEWKALAAEISGERGEEAKAAEEKEDPKEEDPASEQLTEDEIAARQLVADATALQNGEERQVNTTLVIKMKSDEENDPLAEKRAKLFKMSEKDGDAPPKGVPILQQNAVPGMDELADVTEKYRHDVALRPDALDVHSEVYEAIPVEDFGAAMLRGMGWKGTVEEDKNADDPKPRQKLLGLGATAKPKLPGDKNGNHKSSSRRADQPRSNGLNQRDDAKPSVDKKRRGDESEKRDRREKESSRARSRSRVRGSEKEKSSRASDRDRDDRRRDRDRDDDRGRDRDRERDRGRSKSRDRDSKRDRDRRDDREHRERRDDRDRRDDRGGRDDRERRESRDKRKRSRSCDRSSDRKKSSSSRR